MLQIHQWNICLGLFHGQKGKLMKQRRTFVPDLSVQTHKAIHELLFDRSHF